MPAKSLTQFNQRLPSSGVQNYDGSQLKKKDPERYQAITRAIKEGLAPDTIARIFQSKPQTIQGITKTEGLESVAQANLLQELRSTRSITLAALKQAVLDGTIKGKDLAVPFGIVFDKERDEAGKPSQVIRHEKLELTYQAINDLVNQLPKQADVIDVEPVEGKS